MGFHHFIKYCVKFKDVSWNVLWYGWQGPNSNVIWFNQLKLQFNFLCIIKVYLKFQLPKFSEINVHYFWGCMVFKFGSLNLVFNCLQHVGALPVYVSLGSSDPGHKFVWNRFVSNKLDATVCNDAPETWFI